MPKLLENIRTQLLAEAQKQVAERGYAKTTIRSVADACGIAAGTVYNYFSSKEMLVASFMEEAWERCLSGIRIREEADPKGYLREIYETLLDFSARYGALFADEEAEKAFVAVFSARHRVLLDQLTLLTSPACSGPSGGETAFAPRFVAKAFLTWAVEGVPFEALWPYLAPAVSRSSVEIFA